MNQRMDPLTTRPIQTAWEFTIKLYPSWQFGFIDNQYRQFGNSLVLTQTGTQSNDPDPLLILQTVHTDKFILICFCYTCSSMSGYITPS
jgi:hypothetical protein